SPRVTAARLVKRFHLDRETPTRSGTAEKPTAGDSARLLGYAEERARYARTALPATGLADALHAVRRALAGQAYPATRVRAVLLPASTLGHWRGRVRDTSSGAISLMYRLADLLARLSPRRLLRSS